jgi:hypothetical protein
MAGWAPDHVAGANLGDGFALALRPTAAGGDDEGLPERAVLSGSMRTRPVNQAAGPSIEGCEPARFSSMTGSFFGDRADLVP